MQHTTLKQIKFNRGQVTDKLSERSDMGLQNACGTVYDNIYINRYGQLQNAPVPILASDTPYNSNLVCMFDTGDDLVYPIMLANVQDGVAVNVYAPLSKTNQYRKIDLSTPIATQTLNNIGNKYKTYQFGNNVLFYKQTSQPWLLSLLPQYDSWDSHVVLNTKPNYFDGAFSNIFVRGINIEIPSDFTVPTSGKYKVTDDKGITTKKIITIDRNGAGGAFTQSLVGQVIDCPALSGAVQVREVVDADTLKAYVISPLITSSDTSVDIYIEFDSTELTSKWVFGYERPFSDTNGYPDSVCYVNQRLVFGGNDKFGNLIAASRIGVINDFDPSDATESDSFSASISAPQSCRIVDFVQSSDELRIATTYGEYAVSLASFTPSGISQSGFQLRSQVGVKKNTPVCDCGGLTAYVSNGGDAVHATQFSLLQNKYSPISLTSQTSNMVVNCVELGYLKNRLNDEGNCLIGRNTDHSVFVGAIDINAGLIGLSKIKRFGHQSANIGGHDLRLMKLYMVDNAVWGEVSTNYVAPDGYVNKFLVRFTFGEIFAFPTWYRYYEGSIIPDTEHHANEVVIPNDIYAVINTYPDLMFRALYKDGNEYKFITPTGFVYNDSDDTRTVQFADNIDQTNIVCAGFVRQADWRSVEVSVGIATRELNKKIVKIEGVIEPTQITGDWRFKGLVLSPEESKNFIALTNTKGVETIDVNNLSNTSYTEKDVVWRRAFDNPNRELYYGVSMVAPFLIKSITTTIEMDDVA